MSKYTHLLFDFDNTLVDFDKASHSALEYVAMLLKVKADKTYFETYAAINSEMWILYEKGLITSQQIKETRFQKLAKHFHKNADGLSLNRIYLKKSIDFITLLPEAKETLANLHSKYHLSLITNGMREVQRPKLAKVGIQSYFDKVFVSDEINLAKPQVEFFEYVNAQLNHIPKSQILVIGDNLFSDIEGAKRYGADSCLYNPKKIEINNTIKPTFIINKLGELIPLLA